MHLGNLAWWNFLEIFLMMILVFGWLTWAIFLWVKYYSRKNNNVTQPYPTATTRTAIPVIGGILSIASGVISFIFLLGPAIFFFFSRPSDFNAAIRGNSFTGSHFLVLGVFTLVLVVPAFLAIIGGILALKRKLWPLSLIGTIASIFSFAGLLGIAATVLVAISKKEFNHPSPA